MNEIEVFPFGATGLGRYTAIGTPPAHLPESYLHRWLGEASPFLAYGQGAIAVDGDAGALVLTCNPRTVGEPFAAFGGLTLRASLAQDAKDATAQRLMQAAKTWGRAQGCQVIRGPLLFSTWHPYRVADPDQGGHGFPGERVEPAEMQRYYQAAGLDGSDDYVTQAITEVAAHVAPLLAGLQRMPVGPLTAAIITAQISTVHALVSVVFKGNAYYAPIDVPEFAAMLALDPDGSLEPLSVGVFGPADELLGFSVGFGYIPDGLGPDDKIAILKTIGVHPEHRGGIVTWNATVSFHELAVEKGYRTVYHAMMKADNKSRRLSGLYAEPVRTYRLFAGPVDA